MSTTHDLNLGRGTSGAMIGVACLAAGLVLLALIVPARAAAQSGTCPNEAIREQQHATFLPDCRAYEVVSQLPTGGISFLSHFLKAVDVHGDRVLFGSFQPLPGTELPPPSDASTNGMGYLSQRGADGWTVDETALGAINIRTSGSSAPADASFHLDTTSDGLDPDDHNGVADVYRRVAGGEATWISRDPRIEPGIPQTAGGQAHVASGFGMSTMSADGSVVVFASQRQLTDDDTTTGNAFRLYKWSEGDLEFIGARPDGSVPADGSVLGTEPFGRSTDFLDRSTRNAVSHDGSRVVFSAYRDDSVGSPGTTDGSTLYVQTDGQPTVEAVKETGVDPLPNPHPRDVVYRGASADASRVFFTSASRLTPDSGAFHIGTIGNHVDLYVYDLGADKVRDLTPRLDGVEDPEVDPAIEDRARVVGTAGISEDGHRVYFVARGALDAEPSPLGELPSDGGFNLYLAELDGIDDEVEVRFIADVGDDDRLWRTPGTVSKTSYASPDGSVLGFASNENLVTGKDTGGTEQVFVYDAGAHSLSCASCPADGSPAAGDVNLDGIGSLTMGYAGGEEHWVSSEGSVFFHTPTPLVTADRNQVDDVYEYRAGELRLISAGTGSLPSRLDGASADGSTVFFDTADALVPQDHEPGVRKIYAARVGGGFPAPPIPQPPCRGDACQGDPSASPPAAPPGSSEITGPGNLSPGTNPRRCERLAKRAKRLARRAKHRRQRARVLRRRARHQARRDHDERAQRLRMRSRHLARRAKSDRRRARSLRRRARECRREASR